MFRVWWVFVHDFVTNFLLSLTVKEFWKSANIWWSYGQELGVLFFFDSRCRMTRTDKPIDIQTDAVPWQTLLRVLCGQRQYATDLSYRSGMAQTATAIYSTPTILANHYSSCSTRSHSEQNSYPRDPQNALEQVHNLLSYRCDVDVFHAARNSDDDDG